MGLDEKDIHVLDMLKKNSKLTTSQISRKIGLPITTVHNRIKKLEKLEIIKNYTVVLDYKKLDKAILAYVLVTVNYILPSGEKINQEQVVKEVKKLGAEEVSIITGGADIVIKVRTKDVDELNNFIIHKLRKINGVDKTQTMIVLNDS